MSLSDWSIADPEGAGLRSKPLRDLVEWLDGPGEANIHSVLVVRHGRLLFEHYRAGEDECWGEPLGNVAHGPDSKHDLRSVTKSVISLLFGIALDRKLIRDIDEAVIDWFPQYSDLRSPAKERISLRHLLTMSAGLEWNENLPSTDPKNSEMRLLSSADRCRYVLEQPVVAPAGQVWNYNSGGTLLLENVIATAVGGALDDVARDFLFEPLGISDFAWTRDLKSGTLEWGGLRLRSRDFAKIGQLVLNGGNWNGRQIVSQKWVTASTAAHIGPAALTYFYGYQWWLGRSLVGGREVSWICAMGHGGQRIFAVPALDLVAVVTAGLYADAVHGLLPLIIFNRYVLAAIVSEEKAGAP
ncbi:serine hydrolase [Bradyrhizobium sp. LHD-71]|uniref:serine hydrolase domain-containing protein n=1 Tax=Bradyrhizobium sp. LHD-71 TaxID=3072141 RepID=UPI00280DC769|nr:serine hydrolase [Bradyrhizobium sp. LHD-71]MDQ8730542.1 serine hydrolase [Bradyrhizobium sp. LHD-71]